MRLHRPDSRCLIRALRRRSSPNQTLRAPPMPGTDRVAFRTAYGVPAEHHVPRPRIDPLAIDDDVLVSLLAQLRVRTDIGAWHGVGPSARGRDAPTARRRRRWILFGMACGAVMCVSLGVSPHRARADPTESAARWDRARTLQGGAWAREVVALGEILTHAGRGDPTRRRALGRLARRLEGEGFVAASMAIRHRAVAESFPRSDAEGQALAAFAHALADERDPSASSLLTTVVDRHGRLAPALAARALEALSEDALDRGDEAVLRAERARAERLDLPIPTRMRVLDALGRLRLARGDRKEAERLRAACARLHADALDGRDERVARAAARIWLDLPLALALDADPYLRGERAPP